MIGPASSRPAPWKVLTLRTARIGALVFVVVLLIAVVPIYRGWQEGKAAAPDLADRADRIIAEGRGPDALGQSRFDLILMVQDPSFRTHSGVDVTTPGAGITTVTQSLAKRTGFEDFQPGWSKLRQTGLAMGYETGMTKDQIGALWLETLEMGQTPEGWIVGFFEASRALYGKPVAELTEAELADLTARLIAPGRLSRPEGAAERGERVRRIQRLWAGACVPDHHGDVWLEGCA